MQEENFSNYQAWIETKLELIDRVRKRKKIICWKYIRTITFLSVLSGLLCFIFDQKKYSNAWVSAVVIATFPNFFSLMIFFSMLPGFLKGTYIRKINKAMQHQGFSETQREQFAKEQMTAQQNPSHCVPLDLLLLGTVDERIPALFTISEHFACLTGGEKFGPFIVRLDAAEFIHVTSITVCAPTHWGPPAHVEKIPIYSIHFMGHGKEQGRIEIGDAKSRDKALSILCQRFSEETDRSCYLLDLHIAKQQFIKSMVGILILILSCIYVLFIFSFFH